MERLAALPGVRSAGFARYFGTINTSLAPQPIAIDGTPDARTGTNGVMEYISPKFFETVRIPLLRGRDVTWSDTPTTPKVALVSESLARALDPAGNVLGKVIRYGTDPATSQLEIVGVVGNISIGNLRDNDVRIVYMSGVQAGQATYATVQLRVAGDPFAVARPATDTIAAMGREHVQRIVPVNFLFTNSVVAERMATAASMVGAILALAISCAGLFALLSHTVARRTREFGIRMALGASPAAVSTLVLRDTFTLVVFGLAAGIPVAFAAASLVKALLYGVTTTDPATIIASAAMLFVAALASAAQPAVRAVRVDPSIALRAE
jgi:ABC-type antimicrobial peptide transport system permease subunit